MYVKKIESQVFFERNSFKQKIDEYRKNRLKALKDCGLQ